MKIQAFDGGLSLRTAPTLIAPNEATKCINADIYSGAIKPLKDRLLTTAGAKSFYLFGGTFISSSEDRDYKEWQGKLFWSNGGQAQYYDGTTTNNLGIAIPMAGPTLTVEKIPYTTEEPTTVTATTGGDFPSGEEVAYVAVEKRGGIYYSSFVAFGAVMDTGTSTNKVTINYTVSEDSTLYIYRRYPYIYVGPYYLVHSATIAGSYEDITFDISSNPVLPADPPSLPVYDGTVLPDGDYQYAYTFTNDTHGVESNPSPLTDILTLKRSIVYVSDVNDSTDTQVTKKTLYRLGGGVTSFLILDDVANGTTTYTDNKLPSAQDSTLMPSTHLNAPTGLKYLTELYGVLFGAVGDKLYFTESAEPWYWGDGFFFIDFDRNVTGIARAQNGLLVFTENETYFIGGTDNSTFLKYLLSGDQGCILHKSISFVDNVALWLSNDGLCASSGGQIKVVSKDKMGKLSLSPVCAMTHDEVYYLFHSTGVLCADFRFTLRFYELSYADVVGCGVFSDGPYVSDGTSIYELFADTADLTYEYQTGDMSDGEVSNLKEYDKIRVAANGEASLTSAIGGNTQNWPISTSALGITNMGIRNGADKGLNISINITGTAEVREVRYNVKGSSNA